MYFETGEAVYNTHPARERTAIHTGDRTKVVQSAKDDSDINIIVRRMSKTGLMPQRTSMPIPADYEIGVTDYHTAMNMLLRADESFMQLPAKTRARFANSPQNLLSFLSDPNNLEESYTLGLRERPAVVEPVVATPAVEPGT